MKIYNYLSYPIMGFILLSCGEITTKPPHHPKNPNYAIIKPKVQYKPNTRSLESMVKKLQGSPYVWAEEGPNNFDCSGFTYYMYGSMGIEIPRVAREQAKVGKKIAKKDLKYGDLVFFATNQKNQRAITHVGMYLGNGWFTHASTVTHAVIYSNLNTSTYYKNKLRICRRYLANSNFYATNRPSVWQENSLEPHVKPFKSFTRQPINNQENEEKGNFYIQIGSFKTTPSTKMLQKIKELGFKYRVIRFQVQKVSISKLFIGSYHTKKEVNKVLPRIKKQIEASAFLVEIR